MKFGRLLVMLCLFGFSASAHAGLVVIASADARVDRLTREQLINIYMGRYRVLPDGEAVEPLDSNWDGEERRDFYRRLLGKSLEEVNAYWARLLFSGRTSPPREMRSSAAVLERVEQGSGAIGYVERRMLAAHHVKVIYAFPD